MLGHLGPGDDGTQRWEQAGERAFHKHGRSEKKLRPAWRFPFKPCTADYISPCAYERV